MLDESWTLIPTSEVCVTVNPFTVIQFLFEMTKPFV